MRRSSPRCMARDADATRAAVAEDLNMGGARFAAALSGAQ